MLLLLFMLMLLKVTTLESEVKLCTSTVEGLAFLLWRHLEHFLLYTRLACATILSLTWTTPSAATTSGPATPFQAAFNRLHTVPLEQGSVPFSSKAAFSQVSLSSEEMVVL